MKNILTREIAKKMIERRDEYLKLTDYDKNYRIAMIKGAILAVLMLVKYYIFMTNIETGVFKSLPIMFIVFVSGSMVLSGLILKYIYDRYEVKQYDITEPIDLKIRDEFGLHFSYALDSFFIKDFVKLKSTSKFETAIFHEIKEIDRGNRKVLTVDEKTLKYDDIELRK